MNEHDSVARYPFLHPAMEWIWKRHPNKHSSSNYGRGGPWVTVKILSPANLEVTNEYAIWRVTGCVYVPDARGAIGDDPVFVPEGSPYLKAG